MIADTCRNYLLVTAVGGKTPAFAAGLKPGDKIASFNDKPVATLTEFHHLLLSVQPGSVITLGIVYDKEGDAKPLT